MTTARPSTSTLLPLVRALAAIAEGDDYARAQQEAQANDSVKAPPSKRAA